MTPSLLRLGLCSYDVRIITVSLEGIDNLLKAGTQIFGTRVRSFSVIFVSCLG
jgi:hypothetical protein